MEELKPTVGRIVLFRDENGTQYPGIITHVHDENIINLMVFKTDGCVPFTSIPRGEAVRNWDWLPFTKEQAEKTEEEPDPEETIETTEETPEQPEPTTATEAGEVEVEPKTTENQ